MLVRFLRAYGIYNAGEVAGFPYEEAQRLIKLGVAEELKIAQKNVEEPKKDKMVKERKEK